jgi:hypothetical protein
MRAPHANLAAYGTLTLGLAVLMLPGCRKAENTPVSPDAHVGSSVASTSGSAEDLGVAMDRRTRGTEAACTAHLGSRGLTRAPEARGDAQLGGDAAKNWKRPASVTCELCGAPIRDGDVITGRIAVVNAGDATVDVYLQSATHGPFWLETVPPTPDPPSPTPRPEIYPAPALVKLPAHTAIDAPVETRVSPEALKGGGSVPVHASAIFWNGSGFTACGDAKVPL